MKIATLYFSILFLIILCLAYLGYQKYEGFSTDMYSYDPFKYITTGTSPLSFYNYPAYREPYMYPYKFVKSYPTPHFSYNEINI